MGLSILNALAILIMIGCGCSNQNVRASNSIPIKSQNLPVTAIWCPVSTKCIKLEVAKSQEEQQLGLQGRKRLPSDRGMWFPFNPPQVIQFWMYLTEAPLDLIFLSNGRILSIENNAAPCRVLPCPSYGVEIPIDGVIEISGGNAEKIGLRVGDRVIIRPFRQTIENF